MVGRMVGRMVGGYVRGIVGYNFVTNTGEIKKPICRISLVLLSLDEDIKAFEEQGFYNLVLSIKSTNIDDFIKANRSLKDRYPYPIHLGLTEAGIYEDAIVKSSYALITLLKEGIGDTIRVSVTGDPVAEIKAAKLILNAAGLSNHPDIIACPTCARCHRNLEEIVYYLKANLGKINKRLKIAVMGCPVNGLGEARDADICLIANPKNFSLYYKGEKIKDVTKNILIKEIKQLIKEDLDA